MLGSPELQFEFYGPNPEPCQDRTPLEWTRLVFEIFILFFTVIGNLLVILSVILLRSLRSYKNYLILSLASADLLVGAIVLPFKILLSEHCDNWIYGPHTCYVWISVDVMLCTASIMSLTIIAVDRYLAIAHPLAYKVKVKLQWILIAISTAWILAFLLTIPHWLCATLHYYELKTETGPNGTVLFAVCIEEGTSWLHQIGGIAGSFFVPLLIMIFVDINILRVLWLQDGRKILRERRNVCQCPKVLARLAEKVQERKGCIMMAVLMGTFTICWVPFFTLLLADALEEHTGIIVDPPYWVYDVLVWLGYLNSCINPFIYTMFNKDFRYAFKELICFRGCNLNNRQRELKYTRQLGTNSSISRTNQSMNLKTIELPPTN